MNSGSALVLAFAIGIITGFRSMTGLAAVSWGIHLGWLRLGSTGLGFLGHPVSVLILSLFALGELVADKLPKTPSRKKAGPFILRVAVGALAGSALAIAAAASAIAGALCGALGAVAGTLGGYEARVRYVRALAGPDYVVALIEDVIAVGGALFIVSRFA
jgi:uncharacterized membrane protein